MPVLLIHVDFSHTASVWEHAHGPLCTFQCGCVFLSAFVCIAVLSCQNRGGRPLWAIWWVAECSPTAFVIIMRLCRFPAYCLPTSLSLWKPLDRVHVHYENIISLSSALTKHCDRVLSSCSYCGNLYLLKCKKSKNGHSPLWLSFSQFVHNGLIQEKPSTKQCQTKLEREKCEGER